MKNRNLVVLVCPESECKEEREMIRWIPYHLLSLASCLDKARYRTKIVGTFVEPNYKEIITKNLDETLFVGITSMSGSQKVLK